MNKKKVGILTHYNVNNQGAQLQLYALSKELERRGIDTCVMEFEKSYEYADQGAQKRNNPSIASVPYFIKHYIIQRGLSSFIHNYKKYMAHRKFLKENFQCVPYTQALNAVIVGSDEVYSVIEGCNQMMYGYGLNTDILVSYAPSFGQTTMQVLEDRKLKLFVAEGLRKYHCLSARDKQTKDLLEALTEQSVTLVCDPALVHDFQNEILPYVVPKKKYLLVYSYDRNMNTPEEISVIKTYARKNNLCIVSAGTYHQWCDVNISCNCLQWLDVFQKAECVVTDTFHGCIASIVTKRPMAVLTRSINTNKLDFLIQSAGLEQRKIQHLDEIEEVFAHPVDFEYVQENLAPLIQQSQSYLDSIADMIKGKDKEVLL